jgi:serine/threonine-protein kinase
VVYRAHHVGFRAAVALKCLKIPQHFSAEDRARFAQQFQAEAELLFKLSASIPTVVRPLHVEAVLTPDGTFMPFIALEWLEGETLDALALGRARAGQPPFSLDELLLLLEPVARALERAHNFTGSGGPISIVHRDLKPENVFLAQVAGESVVKILDFGIGKAKSVAGQVAGRASQGDGGMTSFTPAYGAPEQWAPKIYGQTGPWTDVWGLALTMVELLAGRPVIEGDRSSMMGTALDPLRRPTPRAEGVAVTDAVDFVFQRALALDPRERFRDAGDFWNALVRARSADPSGRAGSPRGADSSRSRGRSGAPGLGLPAQGGMGRHNLAPDPVGESEAVGLEFDLPEQRPPRDAGSSLPPAPGTGSVRPGGYAEGGGALASRRPQPGSEPPRRSAAVSSSLRPEAPPSRFAVSAPENASEIVRRFAVPAVLVVMGVLTTVVDGAYAASHGEVFTLGPIRLGWLAGALVLGGIGLAASRLLPRDD